MSSLGSATPASRRDDIARWKKIVAPFEVSSTSKATRQLINTVGGYVGTWVAIFFALKVSWWLVVPLAILGGGLVVRAFIIFHDCGHGSFFPSKRANNFWGWVCGAITFTPYHHWGWEHAQHHAGSGNLERRGIGDVWTLTVQEYNDSSTWTKFAYRVVRNPIILFLIAPVFLFVLRERFPTAKANARAKRAVWLMNLVLAVKIGTMIAIFGPMNYLIPQLIITILASTAGVWLFYVQHQFEDTYWEHSENWDFTAAGIEGSSFYKLPKVLQWFSGNIGFHHIHHLSSKIPNYNLEECHNSDPLFRDVDPLTIKKSIQCFTFRLWDEENRKLVSFRDARKLAA